MGVLNAPPRFICGHGGAALRRTQRRQADASSLNFLAEGRRRLGAVAVLISRGPSCDLQTHESPVPFSLLSVSRGDSDGALSPGCGLVIYNARHAVATEK